MSFKATDEKIYNLLQDKLFIIPDNQRKYIWNETNWEELFGDLMLVFEGKLEKHFIGSIVLMDTTIEDGIKNHCTIIDGQQRILTLTILFAAISSIFAEYKAFDRFAGIEKSLIVRDNKALKHSIISEDANQDVYRITKYLFLDNYEEIINERININLSFLEKQLKIKKAVKDCFRFFYERIVNVISGDIRKLGRFSDVVQEIMFVQILAKEEDAYTVFEILNARGKPLTYFELLRNFLLKYSSNEDKDYVKQTIIEIENTLGDYCNIFLKHYAVHKYKTEANSKLRTYKIISDNEKKKADIKSFAKDLLLKCKYYDKITRFVDASPFEKKIFSFFKPRRQQQFRPLLLGLMHQYDLNNINQQEYELAVGYLYSFFICYNVIGEQTSNKIEDVVNGYSYKLENEFTKDVIASMKASMWKKIPSKQQFVNSIKHIKYSHCRDAYSGSIKSENVKAIVEVLELENGYLGSFDNFTIEHCKPDSETEDNDYIGNLILLEREYNELCADKPLIIKANYYIKSELSLPKQIANIVLGGEELDVDDRTANIAELLYSHLEKLS
ncbi:MAG: DUF262 domain-containing protein [Candidatus Izemoplasmatales bacterium]|nr:DUF262 domain-containing protein [Candidatus Izemoplasmatales bacterium]